MIKLAVPVVAAVLKVVGASLVGDKEDAAIARGIAEGTRRAESEVKQLINRHLCAAVFRLTVNSALVIAAVLLLPLWFAHQFALFAIACIYVVSLLHGGYNLLKTFRVCRAIYRKHGFDVKGFVEHEIFRRVYEQAFAQASAQTDNVWHWLFGQKSAADIAERIARESAVNATALIVDYVLKKTVFVVLVIAVYYALARMVVIPFLLTQESQMPFWQTLWYPFYFALQYFWQLLVL